MPTMPMEWYLNDDGYRNRLIDRGYYAGRKEAKDFYPYLERNPQSIRLFAEHVIEKELNEREPNYTSDREEHKRLYIAGFIKGYFNEVSEQDNKAGVTIPPQTWAIPLNTTSAASTTGATITVTNADHAGDIHTYWVRIADPLHFDEAQDFPLPLIVDFSDTTDSDIGTVASGGTPARASARSDAVAASSSQQDEPKWTYKLDPIDYKPTQSQSKMPQKKKPRFYFGK